MVGGKDSLPPWLRKRPVMKLERIEPAPPRTGGPNIKHAPRTGGPTPVTKITPRSITMHAPEAKTGGGRPAPKITPRSITVHAPEAKTGGGRPATSVHRIPNKVTKLTKKKADDEESSDEPPADADEEEAKGSD